MVPAASGSLRRAEPPELRAVGHAEAKEMLQRRWWLGCQCFPILGSLLFVVPN